MTPGKEQRLHEHRDRAIARVDDTVHRPTGWWAPAVHELLRYLESMNFKYSPRVLGFDDQGREILSFIEGESGPLVWPRSPAMTQATARVSASVVRQSC